MIKLDPTKMKDEQLIGYISSGNLEDFRLIIERYQQKLFYYVLKYIADQDKAEDIVQEAFIKMYINLKSFNKNRVFSPWAYRITHNEMINFIRKNRSNVSLEENNWLINLVDPRVDLAKEIDTKIEKKTLYEKLNLLPIKHREILTLYYLEEQGYKEIATILEIPKATVGTRIRRAKRKLRRLFAKEANHE